MPTPNTPGTAARAARRTRPSAWAGHVLPWLLAALATSAAAAVDPLVGATVESRASHIVRTCSTCPIIDTVDDIGFDGGPGSPSAAYASAGPGWALSGRADVQTPDALPELGAYAFADIITAPPDTYLYKASATASAVQRFDYTGSTAGSYTFDFTLDGSFTLGTSDPLSRMTVLGGYTVYGDDYNPIGEFQGTVLGTQFVNSHATLGGMQLFSLPGSVSFTVQPGDTFYVRALLSASADSTREVIGAVDAAHTLAAHFTQGDVALLVPTLVATPVPEAPPQLMLAVGLLWLAWRRGRVSTVQ